MLAHTERHWTTCVHVNKHTDVNTVVTKDFPFARGYNFMSFRMDQDELHWHNKIVSVPMKVLVFNPVKTQVRCVEKKLKFEVNMQADITWTTRTMLAVMATQMGCNVDSFKANC